MRSEVQRVAWRAYWPVTLLAVTFLLVAGIFGTYLNGRQQVANDRAEKQRKVICAILANIPGRIPTEIAEARKVFARPGHPNDCRVVAAKGKPTPQPTVTVSPSPRPTVVVVVRPSPQPAVTVTATPRPRPTPTGTVSPTPYPSPTPSRTCVVVVCLH